MKNARTVLLLLLADQLFVFHDGCVVSRVFVCIFIWCRCCFFFWSSSRSSMQFAISNKQTAIAVVILLLIPIPIDSVHLQIDTTVDIHINHHIYSVCMRAYVEPHMKALSFAYSSFLSPRLYILSTWILPAPSFSFGSHSHAFAIRFRCYFFTIFSRCHSVVVCFSFCDHMRLMPHSMHIKIRLVEFLSLLLLVRRTRQKETTINGKW